MAAGRTGVVITGGGTGGHIFPGLALAAALRRRLPGTDIRFIGSRDRLEATLVPAEGWPFTGIVARGLVGMGTARTLTNALALPVGLSQSLWHLGRMRPRLVVGMGGFVAGPVVAAAWLLGRKVAIHEQNLEPGLTNRILSRMADLVMVSFPETRECFPRSRVAVTGNPVREAAIGGPPEGGRRGFRVLVLGGSQGASSLNRMMERAAGGLEKEGLAVIHQSGHVDEGAVREAYRRLGVEAEVVPFSTGMGRLYRWADLVVCRAGATTIAELAANGCAAVLVPFPGASGGHQGRNAGYLSRRGAAVVVDDRGAGGGEDLAGTISKLRADAPAREALSRNIRELARPGAADEMARACLELMGMAPPPVGERREG